MRPTTQKIKSPNQDVQDPPRENAAAAYDASHATAHTAGQPRPRLRCTGRMSRRRRPRLRCIGRTSGRTTPPPSRNRGRRTPAKTRPHLAGITPVKTTLPLHCWPAKPPPVGHAPAAPAADLRAARRRRRTTWYCFADLQPARKHRTRCPWCCPARHEETALAVRRKKILIAISKY
jgi:hypothetical protein